MLIILLSWIYIFLICLGMGLILNSILHKSYSAFFILLMGMFAQMLVIHFYAVWFPIDKLFYVLNFLLSSTGIFLYRKNIQKQLSSAITQWKTWKKSIKVLSFLLTILILMQSATKPFIVDNETYYLQSIKWVNEFGLVKGLANLHIFFGQMSGWHLLQSGFNFGFISNYLNDINGFLLVICSFYFFSHLNLYFQNKVLMNLYLGLIPILNLFFFPFLNSPSSDMPVFILTQIIFYLFYLNFTLYRNDFRLTLMLSVFVILIKITVFPILILPVILMFKHQLFKKELSYLILIGGISLIAFCLKNYIISGFLFYPTKLFGNFISPDWKLSLEMHQLYEKEYAITSISSSDASKLSIWQYLKYWLAEPGLRGAFNKLIIIFLLIFPLFIKKNKSLFWLYIYAIAQFSVLFFTSPQFRFFFPLILGIGLYIAGKFLLKSPKMVHLIIVTFGLLLIIPLLFPVNIDNLRTTTYTPSELQTFQLKNALKPEPNSRNDFNFESIREGNLIYHSPIGNNILLWSSGDGDLPCVNKKMIEYFKVKYKIRPQLRTNNLKDGFYAEKISK